MCHSTVDFSHCHFTCLCFGCFMPSNNRLLRSWHHAVWNSPQHWKDHATNQASHLTHLTLMSQVHFEVKQPCDASRLFDLFGWFTWWLAGVKRKPPSDVWSSWCYSLLMHSMWCMAVEAKQHKPFAHATVSLKNREAASILTSVGDTVLGYTTKRNSQKSRVSVPWGEWMPPFACSSLHHFQYHSVQPLSSEASLRDPTWCMFVIMRCKEHATEVSFCLKFSRSALSELLVSVKMRRCTASACCACMCITCLKLQEQSMSWQSRNGNGVKLLFV